MTDSGSNSKSSRRGAPPSSNSSSSEDALAALENLAGEPGPNGANAPANLHTNTAAPAAESQSNPAPSAPRPLAKPMPRPAAPPSRPASPPPASDSGLSASGLVGMLAKGGSGMAPSQGDPNSSSGSRAAIDAGQINDPSGRSPNPAVRPMPKPMPVAPTAPSPKVNPLNRIQLAREITMIAPLPTTASATSRKGAGRQQAAVPILYTVSFLLLCVGIWAVLGTLALHGKVQNVPLIQAVSDGDEPDFWYYMPYVMLLCLPVAIALGITARFMQRRRGGVPMGR